jgi:hypothetical protein
MFYIAKVPVVVYQDDKKTIIQPGKLLPELDERDIAHLLKHGSIESAPADAKAEAWKNKKEEAKK